MRARRRAKVVPLPTPPVEAASTDDELELEQMASVVWAIGHAVDAGADSEQIWCALLSVERNLRRLGSQVGHTERRLGWRFEGKVGA